MTKSINDIHDLIQNANTSLEPEFPGAVLDICAALLAKLRDHESLINRMDGELVKITDTQRSVPVEWYHAAVRSHLKAYRELLALGEAVNEHDSKCFLDASVFPNGLLVRDRQRQILAEDSEYQRLLADDLRRSSSTMHDRDATSIPTGTDYSKPHKFELDKDHGTYRVCKCDLSEGNAIHI